MDRAEMTAPTTPSPERQPADAGGGLLPCPWCGGKAKCNELRRGNYRRTGDNYQVVCNKCRARGPLVQDSAPSAIAAWNRRTPAPLAQPDARAVEGWEERLQQMVVDCEADPDDALMLSSSVAAEHAADLRTALQALSAPAADDGWRPSREDVARTIRDRAQIGGTDWQRNAGGADINADDLADAILALRRPAAPEEIKAAYQRGWNDRESDIIERAERIAPQSDALAVLDRLLAYSGARGTYDAMRHGDAVKEAEALLASSADVPEGMMTLADELTEKADELDAMEARGEAWGIGDVVYVLRRAAIAFRRPAAPTDAEERS